MQGAGSRPAAFRLLLAALLLIALHGALLWHSAAQKSATVDELSHLAAGLYAIETGDFRINRTAPPLQNLLNALPVALTIDYQLNFDNENWRKGIWNGAGARLVEANPERFHTMLMRGRLASIVLSMLVCALIWAWSWELWGEAPALIVLVLAAFEPNGMAHGRLTTTDTATTLSILFTGWMLWRFLRAPHWGYLMGIGAGCGAAWLGKHSGPVVFAGTMLALLVGRRVWFPQWLGQWLAPRSVAWQKAASVVAQCLVVGLLGLLTIWAGYGFETGNRIENQSPERSFLWQGLQIPLKTAEQLMGYPIQLEAPSDPAPHPLWRLLSDWLPAYSHWEGFARVRSQVEQGSLGYLMGEFSTQGFTLFYPILFLIKTPLPVLLLIMLGAGLLVSRRVRLPGGAGLMLILPAVYGLALLGNTVAIGYRHALPLVPFLLMMGAGAAAWWAWHGALGRCRRIVPLMIIALAAAGALEAARHHPHYLSYFSPVIGGPREGHHYAIDSNLDWGQDLLILRQAIEEREMDAPSLIYFGPPQLPEAYQVPHQAVDIEPVLPPGTYVISATALHGIGAHGLYEAMAPFRQREPDEYITPALFLYRNGMN